MPNVLSGTIFSQIILQITGQLGTVKPQLSFQKGLTAGTTADWEITKGFIQERSVVAGAPDTLVLGDGSLKDFYGNACAFTKVMVWGIINEDPTNSLTIGAAALHPWEGWISAGGTKAVPKNSHFLDSNGSGYAVGAGATDQLKIVAAAGTIPYAIAILGQ